VSALNADNIAKAFEVLARKVLTRMSQTPQGNTVNTQKLIEPNQKQNNQGYCC